MADKEEPKVMFDFSPEAVMEEVSQMRKEMGEVDEYGLQDSPFDEFVRKKLDETLWEAELE